MRGKLGTSNIYVYDRSLSCIGTVISINSGGVKLDSSSKTFPHQ